MTALAHRARDTAPRRHREPPQLERLPENDDTCPGWLRPTAVCTHITPMPTAHRHSVARVVAEAHAEDARPLAVPVVNCPYDIAVRVRRAELRKGFVCDLRRVHERQRYDLRVGPSSAGLGTIGTSEAWQYLPRLCAGTHCAALPLQPLQHVILLRRPKGPTLRIICLRFGATPAMPWELLAVAPMTPAIFVPCVVRSVMLLKDRVFGPMPHRL